MTAEQFLEQVPSPRRETLAVLRAVILANDKAVEESVDNADNGHGMIVYKHDGVFKYALANGKSRMSLHTMPMYVQPSIRDKFAALLPKAKFMKGCINFTRAEHMPADIVADLIRESAAGRFPVE